MALDEQHEIDQISDATVRGSISRKCVRVQLLSPVLFRRECWNGYGTNACEPQPIFSDEVIKRLENLVSDTKIDVELHERTAVQTRINRKSRAALRRLIELQCGLADDEGEEVGKMNGRRCLKTLSKVRR